MVRLCAVIITLILVVIGVLSLNQYVAAGVLDFLLGEKVDLKVFGNKILYNNQEINLHGVAMGDPHSRVLTDRRTTSDYELISKEWHANTVRLSVHPGVFSKDEKRGKKILEEEVAAARAEGLFVIIDWHVIGMPNGWYKPCAYGEEHYYSYSSNFNTAKDFWKYVATQYRSDNGVIFELWNEPADETKEETWQDLKPYLERLYEIIRSVGAENIVIAPGVWWTYDLRGIKDNPLSGSNIAYSWHNYPSNGNYLKWNSALDWLNDSYPVVLTEWGFSDNPSSSYFDRASNYEDAIKQFITDKKLNFTAWCWHGSWQPAMLKWDWQGLTKFGQAVKNFLIELDIKKNFAANNSVIDNFIKYGADANSRKIGEGERAAVVYSFSKAFGRLPQDENDLAEVLRIANGLCPQGKSVNKEKWAMAQFEKIYLRTARLSDHNDYMAVMIMAYGLRQKAANRNLASEISGIRIFKLIYDRLPSSTEDWNIMQAITYSGAKR